MEIEITTLVNHLLNPNTSLTNYTASTADLVNEGRLSSFSDPRDRSEHRSNYERCVQEAKTLLPELCHSLMASEDHTKEAGDLARFLYSYFQAMGCSELPTKLGELLGYLVQHVALEVRENDAEEDEYGQTIIGSSIFLTDEGQWFIYLGS